MPAPRPAAGGGRWVEVAPRRIERWLGEFAERHGVIRTERREDGIAVVGADGAVAECHVPFPPMDAPENVPGLDLAPLQAHLARRRVVGVLLVRLGGHAAGIFENDRLISSTVDSRLVHGRAAAGGWSQKRFARRRELQARQALSAAAAAAARILLPERSRLDAVITGGDHRAVDTVLADARLAALRPLVCGRFLPTPDPKRAVLQATPARYRAVQIRVVDPPSP